MTPLMIVGGVLFCILITFLAMFLYIQSILNKGSHFHQGAYTANWKWDEEAGRWRDEKVQRVG